MILLSSRTLFLVIPYPFRRLTEISIQLNPNGSIALENSAKQSEACFVDVVVRIKWSTVAGHAQWNAHVGPI